MSKPLWMSLPLRHDGDACKGIYCAIHGDSTPLPKEPVAREVEKIKRRLARDVANIASPRTVKS